MEKRVLLDGIGRESEPMARPIYRLMGSFFDLSLILLGSAIILFPSILVFASALVHPSPNRTLAVYLVVLLSGGLVSIYDIAYRVLVPFFYGGATIGLHFYHLRIDLENGSLVTLKALLIRALVTFFLAIFSLGLYYLVEAYAIGGGSTHRSFVDVVSQTVVIDLDKKPDLAK